MLFFLLGFSVCYCYCCLLSLLLLLLLLLLLVFPRCKKKKQFICLTFFPLSAATTWAHKIVALYHSRTRGHLKSKRLLGVIANYMPNSMFTANRKPSHDEIPWLLKLYKILIAHPLLSYRRSYKGTKDEKNLQKRSQNVF